MNKISKILLGFGVFVLVMGFIARLLLGESVASIYALYGIGAAGVAASIFADLRFYRDLMTMKTTKNGLSLGAVVLLVMILLTAVNYISHVQNVKWDLTSQKLNSLSDQTLNILKNVKDEIEFRGFFRPGDERDDAMKAAYENLVRMYQAENPKVKLFIYDPFKRKDLAEKYKIMTTGEIVVSIGGKQTTVSDISEQVFTNAIVKLTRNTKSVYALTGHGERDLDDTSAAGANQFKKYLEDEGYRAATLDLAKTPKVPGDASVVMVLGPRQRLAESELKTLRAYLDGGGKIFLCLDPGTRSNAVTLASDMGIEFQNQYIQDFYGKLLMKSANFALGLQYSGTHEVTSKIKKMQTIFPLASPLRRSPGAFTDIQTDDLVMTEQSAFAVKDIQEGATGSGTKQQYTLAMAAKGKRTAQATHEFAAVVVGDSDFLSNETIDVLGANRDLALNIMASLSNDSEMISIRPKTASGTPLILTQAENGGLVGLVGFVPLAMFLCAFVAWWRRRGA
jgi:hypothetical protein